MPEFTAAGPERPKELGWQIEWGVIVIGHDIDGEPIYGTLKLDESKVPGALHGNAARMLPPGTRYELRKRLDSDYGRSHGMAWYRVKTMDERETWGRVPSVPEYQDVEGFYFVGEFTTQNAGGT